MNKKVCSLFCWIWFWLLLNLKIVFISACLILYSDSLTLLLQVLHKMKVSPEIVVLSEIWNFHVLSFSEFLKVNLLGLLAFYSPSVIVHSFCISLSIVVKMLLFSLWNFHFFIFFISDLIRIVSVMKLSSHHLLQLRFSLSHLLINAHVWPVTGSSSMPAFI